MKTNSFYMKRAIELAERGRGFVNPNPLVGAVIVKDDKIIGEGWHKYFGGLHAERNALKNATQDVTGATMYVTLEPCCHYGKTPPCTEAILENGIKRVVVGLTDPNPRVAGKGLQILRDAGLEVISGICTEELTEQNRVFLKYITTGIPWIVMKTAMTLDGKIAATSGDSQWVSGEKSRQYVQAIRAENMGIMVGSNTVRLDDPMLNVRSIEGARQPIRIIIDSRAGISVESRIAQTFQTQKTIIVHTLKAELNKIKELKKMGAITLSCQEKHGQVDLQDMLKKIGEMEIDSILLEGGGTLNFSFLKEKLVDEVYAFIAPKYIGGKESKTPVEGEGFPYMREAVKLDKLDIKRVGEDFLIHGIIVNT